MSDKKTLLIVRHAKSSWDYEDVSDIDRPLKTRGISNAYNMAYRLKSKKTIPELIMTSPANRAFHTALIFARECEINLMKFIIEPDIYGAGVEGMLNIIQKVPEEYSCIMLVGHNPDMSELVNRLQNHRIFEMPTCAVATLEFNAEEWGEINRKTFISDDFDFPKKEY